MNTAIWGDSFYTLVYGPSWEEAQAEAQTFGGNLTSITSAEENEFIRSSFESVNIGLDPDVYLIGLYRDDSSSEWKWVNGEDAEYLNWGRKEPYNGGLYGAINTFYEGEKTDDYWGADPGSWCDGYGQSNEPERYGIAEIPLELDITTSDTPTEGAGDFTTSINLSAGSETSGNLAEGAEVFWSISGIDADDLESGALAGSGFITDGKLDIGLSLIQDEDTGESLEISVFSDAQKTQQIGETQSFGIMEGEVDPITGTLGLPGKVNLKSQGKTPFVLYGNEELVFDPEVQDSLINPESLGFGLVPGETLFTAATKKNGTIHASYEDVDGDTYLDFVVKVDTPTIASSELAAGEQDVFAFATTNGGQDLLFTAPSAVFF